MEVTDILAALQAILDQAATDDRPLSDEEAERFAELEAQLMTVNRTEEARARMDSYQQPVRRPGVVTATAKADPVERAFDQYLRGGTIAPELAEFRAQNEAVGSAGGYLVPTEFLNRITERMKAFGGFAEAAETVTTSHGRPLEWTAIDDTANSGEIVAEGAQAAGGADLVFSQKTLGAYKYESVGTGGEPLKVSWELAQDSAVNMSDLVARFLGKRIARKQAVDFISGTGVGQPQGILTPKTAFDEIASNAAGPTYAELLGAVHAIDPEYRDGASWLMNDATLAVLRGLLDGNDRPLWMPADTGSLASGLPGGTLLGYPVIIDQAMPSIGDQTKFLAFGNFREAYIIRRVKDVTLVVLNELFARTGQIGYIAWARADGVVNDANAYAVLAGQNT